MDSTLVAGIVGVAGTLLGAVFGPMVQTRQAARAAQAERMQDARARLYDDAALWAEFMSQEYSGLSDWTARKDHSGPAWERRHAATPLPEVISARMSILAPPVVRSAWKELVRADDNLWFTIAEEYGAELHQSQTFEVPDALEQLVRANATLKAFRTVLRHESRAGS